jgi:UDP:flavonoid glycosyltransferase YjiC (YdhE family)
MLVMPCAWDQPDNAARAVRLGVARTIPPAKYRAPRVAAELRELLDNPAYAARAQSVAAEICKEDGAKAACDALEGLLS